MIKDVNTFRDLIDKIQYREDRVGLMERRNGEFQEITYSEIADYAMSISEYLQSIGINKPDRVAILSTNRMEWGIAYFGITYGGMIAVPVDPKLKKNEIKHILKFSDARAIFTEERSIPLLKEICPDLGIEEIYTLDDSTDIEFSKLIQEGNRIIDERGITMVDLRRDDTASIIFTSGTTGVSKAVELTHWNFIFDTIQSEELLNLSEDDIFLSVLPIHHTFEFTGGFLEPMFCGGKIVYVRSLKSKELLEDLKDSRATMLLGVPLLFKKLLAGIRRELQNSNFLKKGMANFGIGLGSLTRKIKSQPSKNLITEKILKEAGLNSLRVMISGGAALGKDVELGIKSLGLNLIQGYGLSEASPIITINPINNSRPGSIGKPIPGIELKIHNPNKEGVGEIIVRGDNVMKGYYRNPEATEEAIRDGWLHTGDMGKIDEDNFVYISGRKKSVIVSSSGKNIYPEEIEHHLGKSQYVEEVLVMELYNREKGKPEITAIIYPDWEKVDELIKKEAEDESILEPLLKEEVSRVNEKLASYKRVSTFKIREEEFPKTTTGKIKRYLFEEKKISVND